MKKDTTRSVLIDTCAWIEFLRQRPSSSAVNFAQAVQDCLENDQARFCGVVQAELLQGVKSNKEQDRLNLLFDTVPLLETLHEDWITAGHLAKKLRAQGFIVPLTDALIAAVALRNKIPVLTLDKHFEHLIES